MNKRLCFCLILLAFAGFGMCDIRRFAYTYSWFTSLKGEREIELTYTHLDSKTWVSENELEFGITDRYTVAPYFVVSHDSDGTVEGFQIEQRYRVGEFSTKRILPTLYLEVSKLGGEPVEVEGRLIGSYAPKGPYFFSGNLIMTHSLQSRQPVEWGYALGATRIAGRGWYGAEAFGNFFDRQHWIGPSAGMELTPNSRLVGTLGVGLNGQPSQAKLFLAFEF